MLKVKFDCWKNLPDWANVVEAPFKNLEIDLNDSKINLSENWAILIFSNKYNTFKIFIKNCKIDRIALFLPVGVYRDDEVITRHIILYNFLQEDFKGFDDIETTVRNFLIKYRQ